MASKEMYIGKYYLKKKKWAAAINRFKNIIEKYETTIYVEEALHRLVETNYKIGLIDESSKYANLLGYNYQSSGWYEQSYKIFNRDYEPFDIKKKEVVFLSLENYLNEKVSNNSIKKYITKKLNC